MKAEADSRRAVVSVRHLAKSFGSTRALVDVTIDFLPGEIHALIGQNGSGKSTLVKVLSGYHAPDHGSEVIVDGKQLSLPIRASEVGALGFSFVHQDLGLADSMSILENTRVGAFDTGPLWSIKWKAERQRVRRNLEAFDLAADPSSLVRDLTQAERTVVAIVRALQSRRGRLGLVVMDEPTAYLPRRERDKLFGAMRRLASTGVAVVFVTHRLDEVKTISDRVSVLRDGALVGSFETAQMDEKQLIVALTGKELGQLYPAPPTGAHDEVVLRVRELTRSPVDDLSFDVHRGEVVGLTGLVGMGQDEVPYLLFGATPAAHGEIEIRGQRLTRWSPRTALGAGMALLPANRLRDSGVGGATLKENLTLPALGSFFRGGRIQHKSERNDVRTLLQRFDVRPRPDPDLLLSSLSGGNQQKALLGKWLRLSDLSVLILHEPTQGVDIGSRQAVFQFIREAAAHGTAIVIASAEYEDLAHLCDRVLVMRSGRIGAQLRGQELSQERIIEQCYVSAVGAVHHASA